MNIIRKPAFRKSYKKLKPKEKEVVDQAIQDIIKNPSIGQIKKGDLHGLWVHKFKFNKQQKLLAYFFTNKFISLVYFGTHENFYRDLKKNV